MKYREELALVLLFTISLWLACAVANASPIRLTPCTQENYDMVYRKIIQVALKSENLQEDMDMRNDSIENLRELCGGMVSSYEVQE